MEAHDDELTIRSSRKFKRKDQSTASQASKRVDKAQSDKLLLSRDARILQKKDFGPYKTKDLVAFLKCFQSLPPEINMDDDELKSVSIALTTASKDGKENGDEAFKEKKEDEAEDKEWDDLSLE